MATVHRCHHQQYRHTCSCHNEPLQVMAATCTAIPYGTSQLLESTADPGSGSGIGMFSLRGATHSVCRGSASSDQMR
jgi:hypothetical protein